MRHGNGNGHGGGLAGWQGNVSCQLAGKATGGRGWGGEVTGSQSHSLTHTHTDPPTYRKPHFRSPPQAHRHFISVLVCWLIYWAPSTLVTPSDPFLTPCWVAERRCL